MTANKFNGVWTALITPFSPDGEIDWPSYEALLKRQELGGVAGVVVSGTTGESPTLAVQEKLALIRKARATLSPAVRVMAGTGGNNTNQSVELSRLAVDAGADSLLIVTPPYNKPSNNGLKLHFQSIADAVNVPLCLYHVPGRTAQLLSHKQISMLCEIPSIKAVKEASGDVALFSRALNCSQASFLTGDDPTYLASLAVGGIGVISVVSNVFPEAMVKMTKDFIGGNIQSALEMHNILLPMIDILFCEANPVPTKAAFSILGYCGTTVRAPLAVLEEQNFEAVKSVLKTTQEKLEKFNG